MFWAGVTFFFGLVAAASLWRFVQRGGLRRIAPHLNLALAIGVGIGFIVMVILNVR